MGYGYGPKKCSNCYSRECEQSLLKCPVLQNKIRNGQTACSVIQEVNQYKAAKYGNGYGMGYGSYGMGYSNMGYSRMGYSPMGMGYSNMGMGYSPAYSNMGYSNMGRGYSPAYSNMGYTRAYSAYQQPSTYRRMG